MKSEIFTELLALPDFLWQSTLFIVAGLICSFALRRRSARAHQLLLLAMIAAVTVPGMSTLVRHLELGLLTARPTVRKFVPADFTPTILHEAPTIIPDAAEIPPEPIVQTTTSIAPKNNTRTLVVPWRKILLYGWLTMTVVLLSRLIISFVHGIRLLRQAQPVNCVKLKESIHQAGAKLGIDTAVQIYSSHNVPSPVIWCWRSRPVLIMPADAGQMNKSIDWTGVLCHELAHFKRRDYLSGLIAELIVCFFPWHPLFWWAKSRLIRLSEQACDDWVIATGQSGTDYAESLLELVPGRQMAFIPAVVNSKKGLSDRIRRILKDNFGNPQTGILWALMVSATAICLAVGFAFAQTRPSKLAGKIKTRLGNSSAIEQLSFTLTIKGQILDPNNEPADYASIIAMPVTSYGATTNKEGNFQFPWSPTYIDENQPICLIVISFWRKNEAAIVEVTDPALPVTIHLKPACTFTGKIVDPDGKPLSSTILLSLDRPYKCNAPILIEETSHDHFGTTMQGKFSLSRVPYNRNYKVNIKAEGYKAVEVIVDIKDATKREFDIGTIVLQPEDPARPVVAEEFSNPDLEKEFHALYSLEDNEVIKLIKPPFLLGRQEYLQEFVSKSKYPGFEFIAYCLTNSIGGFQGRFIWDDKHIIATGTGFTDTSLQPSIEDILHVMLRMPYYEFNLPDKFDIKMPYGDWIIRADSTTEEQLRALEEIIQAETNRSIRFEKRPIGKRDTIIVRGRYSFKPLSEEYEDLLCIYIDKENIPPLFTAIEKESLPELFSLIAEGLNIPIEDRTEPAGLNNIRYVSEQDLLKPFRETWPKDRKEQLEKDVPILLDNLAKQTGLKFDIERRLAEVWFVTEQNDNK